MREEVVDLTIKSGKTLSVLNTQNTPVVANEAGQTLGGQKFGKVSAADLIAKQAIESGFLTIVS